MRGKISMNARILYRDQGRSNSKNFHFHYIFISLVPFQIFLCRLSKAPFISLNMLSRLILHSETVCSKLPSVWNWFCKCVFSINSCLWWLISLGIWGEGSSLLWICGPYTLFVGTLSDLDLNCVLPERLAFPSTSNEEYCQPKATFN